VKHGVNTMTTTCVIGLSASCDNHYLNLSISNDFDPDAVPRKGTGTGLSNVRKRLSAIYGRTDLLSTRTKDSNFEVKLQLPKSKRTEMVQPIPELTKP